MGIFGKRPADAVSLKGGGVPALATANLAALQARPCIAADWHPTAVGVHQKRFGDLRKAHRYLGEVVVEVTGAPPVRMLNHDDDLVAYVYFFFGRDSYESLSVHLFASFAAAAAPGEAVLDIGAFTGLFGLIAAAANPVARVTSFEPIPHIAARARLNGGLNGLRNYRVEDAAVSDRAGRRRLTLFGGDSATTGASLASKPRSDIGGLEVEVITVDHRAGHAPGRVALIKLDTEGDEVSALSGAAETLRRDHPVVLSEVLNDAAVAAQVGHMAACGYRAWFINEAKRRLIPVGPDFTLKGRGFGNLIFLHGPAQEARARAVAEAFSGLVTRA